MESLENKALVRQFYRDVLGEWNFSSVKEVVSPAFWSHDWTEGTPTGPRSFIHFYSAIRTALPDARYDVDDVIAEDDKVVVRWRLLGTHLGPFRGIAPTGHRITLNGIAIYRIYNNMLVERWVETNLLSLIERMHASKEENDVK